MFAFAQQPQAPPQNQNISFISPNPQFPSLSTNEAQGFPPNNQLNQPNSQANTNFMNPALSAGSKP